MTAQAEQIAQESTPVVASLVDLEATSAADPVVLSSGEVVGWVERLATGGDLGPLTDSPSGELCDLLQQLEVLKNASAAAQARVTVLAEATLREEALAAGVPEETAAKGISQQLALARRESPHAGSRHVGFARAVVTEMPATHAALTAGLIGEWTATQVVKETACLSVEHRRAVDAHLAGRFGVDSHRAVVAAAKAKAYELDPYSVVNRGRKARSDRRVSVRPAPDVMSIVSGYLPAAEGVACFKALDEAAKTLKSAGDERSLDQLRADLFAERLTGRATAEGVNVEVGLVMTDKALLGLDETPGRLEGYGPIPAPLARDLVREPPEAQSAGGPEAAAGDASARAATGDASAGAAEGDESSGEGLVRAAVVWLRRLYADPATGVLAAQDDRRRLFTGPLRRFLVARDQVCRTPWCDAPVRHADHVVAWARGGRTTAEEGEGLCEACNYAKEASGWSHEVVDLADGTHTVKITTPTGHTYYSAAPPVLSTLAPDGGGLRGCDGTVAGSTVAGSTVAGAAVPGSGEEAVMRVAEDDSGPTRPWQEPAPLDHGPEPGRASPMNRACPMSRGDSRHVVTLRLKPEAETPCRASGSWGPLRTKLRLLRVGSWRTPTGDHSDGSSDSDAASRCPSDSDAASPWASPLERHVAERVGEAA